MVDNWGWGSKEIHWVSSPWILTCQRYKNLHVGRGLPNPVTKALILRLNFSLGIVYKSTATQGGLRRESTPLFACCLSTAAKTKLEQPSLLQYLFATLPSCLPIPHFLTPNFLSFLFSLTLIQNKMLEVSRILFSFELLNHVSCRNVLVLYGEVLMQCVGNIWTRMLRWARASFHHTAQHSLSYTGLISFSQFLKAFLFESLI